MLGMASPVDQLAATPSVLAHLLAECDDARLDAPAKDGWSARTIVAHLRDDELLCMRLALERILAEDEPELRFLDGADWEPTRNRSRDRKQELLAGFALQRQASLGVLGMLRSEDWRRRGRSQGQLFSVEQLVERWAAHDREHIAQLERAIGETLDEVRTRRARPVEEAE